MALMNPVRICSRTATVAALVLFSLATGMPACSKVDETREHAEEVHAAELQAQRAQDREYMNAFAQAKARMPEFMTALEKKDKRYTRYLVCAKYYENHEYVMTWYSDVTMNGPTFDGKHYDPQDPSSHGHQVSYMRDSIVDWMMVAKDNKVTGGFTLRVRREKMTPQERADFDKAWKLKFD